MDNSIRDNIINYGLENNYTVKSINNVLREQGEEEYNPLTYGPNYTNLGSRALENLKDIPAGMRTMGGTVVAPFITESKRLVKENPEMGVGERIARSFIKGVQDKQFQRIGKGALAGAVAGSYLPIVGTLGGAITGGITGLLGGPKEMGNAMLASYNTSIEDIASGNTGWQDIAQGIMENPVYAGLDALSLGGVKAGSKAMAKAGKVAEASAPSTLKALIPSRDMRDFNRMLSQETVSARAKQAGKYEGFNTLDVSPNINREGIVRDLVANDSSLLSDSEKILSKQLKKDLRANETAAIRAGLITKEESRLNTVAQYAMSQIGSDDTRLFQDVANAIQDGSYKKDKVLKGYVEKGNELYNDGDITWLTQALATSRDPLGMVRARDLAGEGYWGTKRIIGRTTPKELGDVLERSVKYQLDQVTRANEATAIVDRILSQEGIGKLITDDNKKLVDPTKTPISKKQFRENLVNQFRDGGDLDVVKALKDARVNEVGSYLVDNMYLGAIENALKVPRKSLFKTINNALKKALLANPHFVLSNRFGNWSNNSMGGVGIRHYRLANRYAKYIPDALKQQTSFNSYIGQGLGGGAVTNLATAVQQPLSHAIQAINEFKGSKKTLGNLGTLAGDLFAAANDITANPIFKAESAMELIDRYANFIKQAEDMSGGDTRKALRLIKQSNKDADLFNKLNNQVNKDLGDYVGRNYFLPNEVYDVASATVPFYRFLTQTGRTTLHQLSKHPLAFQTTVMSQAKAGKPLTEAIQQQYDLDPDRYEGGVPYFKSELGDYHTVGLEPLPIGTILENAYGIGSGTNIESIVSPLLTAGADITRFQKMEGKAQATTPRKTYLQLTGSPEAQNFEPTMGERAAYGVNLLGKMFFNPYRWTSSYLPEIQAALTGKGLQAPFDTAPTIPNPRSYVRTTPEELVGRYAGIQTREVGTKRKASKSQLKKAARGAAYTKRMMKLRSEGE